MFARFDENPAMTLQDFKETKRYRRTDGRTHTRTHTHTHARTDNMKTVYPPQTKFAGGIIIKAFNITFCWSNYYRHVYIVCHYCSEKNIVYGQGPIVCQQSFSYKVTGLPELNQY